MYRRVFGILYWIVSIRVVAAVYPSIYTNHITKQETPRKLAAQSLHSHCTVIVSQSVSCTAAFYYVCLTLREYLMYGILLATIQHAAIDDFPNHSAFIS